MQCATPAKKALIRHLRQRWYKSREYRHRQQTPPCGTNTPAQTTPTRATGATLACERLQVPPIHGISTIRSLAESCPLVCKVPQQSESPI